VPMLHIGVFELFVGHLLGIISLPSLARGSWGAGRDDMHEGTQMDVGFDVCVIW